MANPEMVVPSNSWMPIAAALMLIVGLLFALKMTSRQDTKGDRS